MLKMIARLEHKIGERVYHLLCDSDSPTVEIKEAISSMLGYVVNVETQAKAQAEAQEKEGASPVELSQEQV
jgi:hypothetical protein